MTGVLNQFVKWLYILTIMMPSDVFNSSCEQVQVQKCIMRFHKNGSTSIQHTAARQYPNYKVLYFSSSQDSLMTDGSVTGSTTPSTRV